MTGPESIREVKYVLLSVLLSVMLIHPQQNGRARPKGSARHLVRIARTRHKSSY